MKTQAVFDEVNHDLIGRETEVELMILAWIAKANACFIGEPGTAKSMMVERMIEAFGLKKNQEFVQLMHKYLPPEELIGPIKLSQLKLDNYERVMTNMIQESSIAFLDEIWKCSPALLTTMFRMLNEKKFRNGTSGEISIPLECCIAASNEYPIGEGYEDVAALWDRFAIRKTIRPIGRSEWKELLFGQQRGYSNIVSSLDEMHQWQSECEFMRWTTDAQDTLLELLGQLENEGIRLGNRRQRIGVKIAQASAVYYGHREVLPSDCDVLKFVYWVHPDDEGKAAETIGKLTDPAGHRIQQILADSRSVVEGISDFRSPEAFTALRKIKDMMDELENIPVNGSDMSGLKAKTAKDFIHNQLLKLQNSVIGVTNYEPTETHSLSN